MKEWPQRCSGLFLVAVWAGMSIPVKCQCGAGFAAKDELAGKTVRCPKCKQPLTIPAPQPAAGDSLFDDLGLAPVVTGPVCTNCKAPMPPNAVLCVKCGYHTKLGRQLSTVATGGGAAGGGGHGGHGAVAGDLLARAALAAEEEREAERAKTSEGMPVWAYLAILGVLLGFAGLMSVMQQKHAMVLTGVTLIVASLMVDNWCFAMVVRQAFFNNIGHGFGVLIGDLVVSAIGFGVYWFVEDWWCLLGLYLWGAVWKIYAMVHGDDCGIYIAIYKMSGFIFTAGMVLYFIAMMMGDGEDARRQPALGPPPALAVWALRSPAAPRCAAPGPADVG